MNFQSDALTATQQTSSVTPDTQSAEIVDSNGLTTKILTERVRESLARMYLFDLRNGIDFGRIVDSRGSGFPNSNRSTWTERVRNITGMDPDELPAPPSEQDSALPKEREDAATRARYAVELSSRVASRLVAMGVKDINQFNNLIFFSDKEEEIIEAKRLLDLMSRMRSRRKVRSDEEELL